MVREDLTTGNPLFHILGHYCRVNWHRLPIEPGNDFAIDGIEHLRFTSVALKSKAPPYSPHRDNPHEGDNIGMRITDTRSGRQVFYAPGLGEIEPHLRPLLRAGRRGHGGRHLLDRRRDGAPGHLEQARARDRPPAAVRRRAA